jgi:hypothetical protein
VLTWASRTVAGTRLVADGGGGAQADLAGGGGVAAAWLDDVDEGGDRLEGVGVEDPGLDEHGGVADEADLDAVAQERVDVGVAEVRQGEEVVARGLVEVDAAAQELDQGVEGLGRDVAGGVELDEVVLVVDVDEGLVLGGAGEGGQQCAGERSDEAEPEAELAAQTAAERASAVTCLFGQAGGRVGGRAGRGAEGHGAQVRRGAGSGAACAGSVPKRAEPCQGGGERRC